MTPARDHKLSFWNVSGHRLHRVVHEGKTIMLSKFIEAKNHVFEVHEGRPIYAMPSTQCYLHNAIYEMESIMLSKFIKAKIKLSKFITAKQSCRRSSLRQKVMFPKFMKANKSCCRSSLRQRICCRSSLRQNNCLHELRKHDLLP